MNTYSVILTIVLAFILIVILGIFIFLSVNKYIKRNYKLLVVLNSKETMQNSRLVINVYNVDRNAILRNSHSDNLTFFSHNHKVSPSKFERDIQRPNIIKITLPSLEEIDFKTWVSLQLGLKYNSFAISVDNGKTKIPAISISDKEQLKAVKKTETKAPTANKLKKDFFNDLNSSDKNYYLDNKNMKQNLDGLTAHINESKSTPNSLRYQVIIPDDHEKVKTFNPSELTFYYLNSGLMYEIESNYLGRVENFYEWDLVNLEPGTIYVGFSFSLDGGKTIYPSFVFYGITRYNTGVLPIIDEAQLACPKPKDKPYKMWNEKTGIDSFSKSWIQKMYQIIVKKHLEYENKDLFISLKESEDHFEDYPWLKVGAKLPSSTSGKNTTKTTKK